MSTNRRNLFILMGLTLLFLLSGCLGLYGGDVSYLDIELLTEDELVSFNEGYVNLTTTDLSSYPTLQNGIMEILNPINNITSIFVEITNEEMNRITSELLNPPNRPYYSYIAFNKHIFQISFAVT